MRPRWRRQSDGVDNSDVIAILRRDEGSGIVPTFGLDDLLKFVSPLKLSEEQQADREETHAHKQPVKQHEMFQEVELARLCYVLESCPECQHKYT